MSYFFQIYLSLISLRESKSATNQRFLYNSEFKTSASRCWVNQFWILFFYDDKRLLIKQTYLRRHTTLWGNNPKTLSFFVFRWPSIFWITNGSSMLEITGAEHPLNAHLVLSIEGQFSLTLGFTGPLTMHWRLSASRPEPFNKSFGRFHYSKF